MEIVLYSTHCPKCIVLEKKLQAKGIQYNEVNDVKAMIAKKILSAPMLEVDGHLMDFAEAVQWTNEQGEQ